MNHLTTQQKREFLATLLSKGKADAETFLAESVQPDYWFTSLPFEMQLAVVCFLNENNPISDEDFSQAMQHCLNCCSGDDFEKCLDDETQHLKNRTVPL